MLNRHMKRALIGLPILLFIILNTYLFLLNESLFASEKPYDLTKIEQRDLRETIEAAGMFIPKEIQEFYYEPHRGNIEEVLVEEGEEISSGTEILKYQTTDIENQITALENEIDELETEKDHYEDRETILQEQIRSESNKEEEEKNESTIFMLEQQEADAAYQADRVDSLISSKESEISLLESRLDEKVVKSNVAGTVKKVNRNAASSDQPLVVISSEDNVLVRAYLSEDEVVLLREGDEVAVSSPRGEDRKGQIVKIGTPDEENEDLKFPVDIEVETEAENRAPVGSTVNITFKPVAVEDAIAVKHEWVVHDDGEDLVLVVKNDHIDKRKISVGFENETYKEVTKGLKAGETIVMKPNVLLVDDMEIETKDTGKKKKDNNGEPSTDDQNGEEPAGGENPATDSNDPEIGPDSSEGDSDSVELDTENDGTE
ncbi:efflux RND transporter periplasmic adaptor subunit [Bacillus sp. Marseille-Q3570]|uniref:efflux RND transporter periplasmic adaptor subunit n=1 Tax=Bacillus sp. Marseille-Q3570 TaxID=2963522 RepID=UPI0021B7A5C1|nr:HlyD family efflux transporter periplasmic adaptor subunit [Bacillus sp. Marseille-Q3570]